MKILPYIAGLTILIEAMAAQAADFPRWRGENSNGSAGEPGMPLIRSWDEARIAWASEVKAPHPWNFSVVRGKTQWPRTVLCNTGYSQPSVWDGKIYVTFWRPSGTAHAVEGEGKYPNMWARSGIPALTLIDADEVIVCIDAATGRTLWEAVWPGKEMNHAELYGGHNNICIANGKAYAIGNTGWAYCADAKTGAKRWASPVGPSAKIWEVFKKECIEKKLKSDGPPMSLPKPDEPAHPLGGSLHSQTYNVCPMVADGVMITGEWSAGGGLVGFDAETGQELWRSRDSGGLVPPLLWKHGGREYAIVAAGSIICLDPKTGKRVWTTPDAIGNGGYNQSTPAIDGDYLVGHGGSRKGTAQDQREGWVCYKLGPDKAEKVWVQDAAYLGTSYIAATVHRGFAWVVFERAAGKKGLTECDPGGSDSAMACIRMADGKVMSELPAVRLVSVCPGPVAMGDRMFYLGDQYLLMAGLDPKAPRVIGAVPQPVNYCSSATAADGFVYFRSAERLVVCMDVRAPSSRPKPTTRHDDPANAFYQVALPAARVDGKDVRFSLRGREGKFLQSWAETVAPGYHYPDVLEAERLELKNDRVTGKVRAYVEGTKYEFALDMGLGQDGSVVGKYEDLYRGLAVTGEVSGTMLAWAKENGEFAIYWPRHWFGGQNQSHEHIMKVNCRDGVVKNIEFIPRLPHGTNFWVKVKQHDLQFDGTQFTGSIDAVVESSHLVIAGRYVLRFDGTVANNLLAGKVTSRRDGAKETTHEMWGHITVPETDAVKPERAVYNLWLPKCVEGKTGIRLYVSSDGGKVCNAIANVQGCAGLHKVDGSGLKVEGDRLTGEVRVSIHSDGYMLRADSETTYRLDVKLEKNAATGSYDGIYDVRAPRFGAITGTYRNS